MTKNTNSTGKNLLAFGVGLAAGWMVKQLFDSPQVREKRQEMLASIDELKARLQDPDEQAKILEIFGTNTQEVTKAYRGIKDQIIAQLSDLDVSFDEIDRTKYQSMVTEIIMAAVKDGKVPKNQVDNLKSALVEDFNKLHVSTKDASTKPKKDSKKLASK